MKFRWNRLVALSLAVLLFALCLTACGPSKKKIVIYATSEDFRIDFVQQKLNEAFPEYDIHVQYESTGTLSSLLLAQGKNFDADIIYELETTYLEKLGDQLAVLEDVNFDVYLDELVPASHRYVPLVRTSGAIVVNKTMLTERGLPVPTCYDDLLKPEYKGLVSMSNPTTSGTGYIFYLNMVNERGLEAALAYFDKLAENISGAGFTSSGSGPITGALKMGEAAIGLGMTFQAVNEINNGADYEILYFDEGAPYNIYSCAVLEGKQHDEDVMRVFRYILSDVAPKDNELYTPEKIFKDKTFTIENFPENIPYADMSRLIDTAYKDELLDQWKY